MEDLIDRLNKVLETREQDVRNSLVWCSIKDIINTTYYSYMCNFIFNFILEAKYKAETFASIDKLVTATQYLQEATDPILHIKRRNTYV